MKKIDNQLKKVKLFNELLAGQDADNTQGALDCFLQTGIAEHRKQNLQLDLAWYRTYCYDVGETDIDAFTHYVLHGKQEGRFQNESEQEASSTSLKIAVVVHVFMSR